RSNGDRRRGGVVSRVGDLHDIDDAPRRPRDVDTRRRIDASTREIALKRERVTAVGSVRGRECLRVFRHDIGGWWIDLKNGETSDLRDETVSEAATVCGLKGAVGRRKTAGRVAAQIDISV